LVPLASYRDPVTGERSSRVRSKGEPIASRQWKRKFFQREACWRWNVRVEIDFDDYIDATIGFERVSELMHKPRA
jgi:hypothetical protein